MIILICCWLLSGFEKSSLKPVTRQVADEAVSIRAVPNNSFRLFGRIRIVLFTFRPSKNTNANSVGGWAFDVAPAVLIFTTSLCPSLIRAVPACCLAMTLSPSFVSHNQAVWARASGTDWVKSALDVTSCTIHVQTNYSYSFWRHYSSEYEYKCTIPTTIRNRSEYEANIRYIPSFNSFDCTKWDK